jgi:hypothetical protein
MGQGLLAGWAWAVFVGVSAINDDSTRQGIIPKAIKNLHLFIDLLLQRIQMLSQLGLFRIPSLYYISITLSSVSRIDFRHGKPSVSCHSEPKAKNLISAP